MIENYIVYSTVDGDIRVNIQCVADDIQMQCGSNEEWMQHSYVDDSLFKVDLNTLEIIPIQ
jgi:hypothetical protein